MKGQAVNLNDGDPSPVPVEKSLRNPRDFQTFEDRADFVKILIKQWDI